MTRIDASAHDVQHVHGVVDHLFRQISSRLVAALVRAFGPAHLDLAEEVVQEAMVRALRRWPFSGVPERPDAWLYRVARNLALDRLRRVGTLRDKEPVLRQRLDRHVEPPETTLERELDDDQLRLVFLSCHPSLPRDSRVALVLRVVGGFSAREIGRAFLAAESTVAQRLVRARKLLRADDVEFEVPSGDELRARLGTVLEAIYLIFDGGYSAYEGDELVRADVCAEALRLAELLAAHPRTAAPKVSALAALLAFQSSRLAARVDAAGEPVRLDDQDRALWDHRLIARGFRHLDRSIGGDEESVYHLQAVIASCHAGAPDAASTPWDEILRLYDRLLALQPSPVVALNRAVALAHVDGPSAGLEALDDLTSGASADRLGSYHLLAATRGELLLRRGDLAGAAGAWRAALQCPCSEPERRFLERRLAELTPPN